MQRAVIPRTWVLFYGAYAVRFVPGGLVLTTVGPARLGVSRFEYASSDGYVLDSTSQDPEATHIAWRVLALLRALRLTGYDFR